MYFNTTELHNLPEVQNSEHVTPISLITKTPTILMAAQFFWENPSSRLS